MAELKRLAGRRVTAVLWLLTVVVLGLAAHAQLSTRSSLKSAGGATPSVDARAAAGPKSSQVTPIEHELQGDQDSCILTAAATEDPDCASDAQNPDERFRAAIVGKWEDDYRGKRHLTVGDDGAGTMVVEPDGLGRALFADRLSFDLVWSISDGRVTMRMLGGEPESKVNLILKLHGREAVYRILNLDDDQMLLLDPNGQTRYDWRRPEEAAAEK
jgi:hypothetical protein